MHEARCGLVCGDVLDLHESVGRASATPRKNIDVGSSHFKMGRDYDGFYHKVASDGARGGFDMGHCQLIDQEHAFHFDSGNYFGGEAGRNLHSGGSSTAWSAGFGGLGLRFRFTSRFWKKFHEDLGTRLHFSTTFYPQTNG